MKTTGISTQNPLKTLISTRHKGIDSFIHQVSLKDIVSVPNHSDGGGGWAGGFHGGVLSHDGRQGCAAQIGLLLTS